MKLDEGNYQCALVTSKIIQSTTNTNDNTSSTTNKQQHHLSSKSLNKKQRWKILKLHQFHLKLVEPPRLAPFEFANDATVGMRVLITCSILRGQKPISFVWLKDNQIIASQDNQHRNEPSSLLLTDHSRTTTTTTTSGGGGLSLAQLHRQQLAESRLSSLSPESSTATQISSKALHKSQHMTNKLNGYSNEEPRLDYVIYNHQSADNIANLPNRSGNNNNNNFTAINNDNQLLALLSDPSIKIKHSDDYSILSIENLELKHSGRYTCSAYNEVARATHTSQLIINGKCP